MEARKKAFYDHYKANPSKLKGKSIDEAYNAMRKEANRTGHRSTKANAGGVKKNLSSKSPSRVAEVKGGITAAAKRKAGGSPWKKFQNEGGVSGRKNSEGKTLGDQFRDDTKKFQGKGWYRNHVEGQKKGAKAFFPDDILGNKARKENYKKNAAEAAKRKLAKGK